MYTRRYYWNDLVNVQNISATAVEAQGIQDHDNSLGWYYATMYGTHLYQ